MSGSRELGRWVYGLTVGLAVALASGSAWTWGIADAVGALVGSGIMLADFAGLWWTVERLTGAASGDGAPRARRRALWVGASGARLGLVGLALGLAIRFGGVGLRGLLVSLTLLPVTLVAAGLRTTRPA